MKNEALLSNTESRCFSALCHVEINIERDTNASVYALDTKTSGLYTSLYNLMNKGKPQN